MARSAVEQIDNITTLFADTVSACHDCSMILRPGVVTGSFGDSILLRKLPIVVRDSRGRIVAAVQNERDHPILVYDNFGKLLRRIGHYGAGPGEYGYVRSIAVGPVDSIYVAHDRKYLSVFDSAGRHGRTVQVDGGTGEIVPLHDGLVLTTGNRSTPESIDLPLHLVAGDGTAMKSFGTPNVIPGIKINGRLIRWTNNRLAVRAGESAFWVTEFENYRLELVDTTGRVHRVIAVSGLPNGPNGFATPEAAKDWTKTHQWRDVTPLLVKKQPYLPVRPFAKLASIRTFGTAYILVATHVAVDEWNSVEVRYKSGTEEAIQRDEMKENLFRTVIDVLETQSGALVARKILPGYALLADSATVARPTYDPEGVIRIETYSLALHVPSQDRSPNK